MADRNDRVVAVREVHVVDLRELLNSYEETIVIQSDDPETINLGVYERIVRMYGDNTIQVTLLLVPERTRLVRLQ